jgi:hypothetical protein
VRLFAEVCGNQPHRHIQPFHHTPFPYPFCGQTALMNSFSRHRHVVAGNMLTQDLALDPIAKIPEYKVCAVRILNPQRRRKKKPVAVA